MKIYPAILSDELQVVQNQLDMAMNFDDCATVQIDLIDGFFVDNLTVTPADLADCEFGELTVDFHIMAIDPEDVVNEIVEYTSQLPVRAIIGQVEKMGNEHSFVEIVRRHGWQAGMSLDVDTDLESIDTAIWRELQVVQVMGVPAGEQGQAFVKRSLDLVDQIVRLRQEHHLGFELVVDGGIRPALLETLAHHHVDSGTVGSFIWQHAEPAQAWQEITR
jgi:ribulose-phosphate 3-epimerase